MFSGWLGWVVFTGLFDLFVGKQKETGYIDRSVHHYYHQNLTIINNDEPPITITNERTGASGQE